MFRKMSFLALAIMLLILLSCAGKTAKETPLSEGKADAASSIARATVETDWEKIVRQAKKEGMVVVYGPPIPETRAAFIKEFQKLYPEITLEYTSGRSSELSPRIKAERRAGLFIADMHIGGTTTVLTELREFAVPLKHLIMLPEVKDTKLWFDGKLDFADEAEQINLVFTTYINPLVVYNTNLVNPNEISSLWDLTKPIWKDKIVMRDPRTAGGGLATASFWYYHPQLGPDFIKTLAANKPALTRDNRLQVEWLARGRYSISISSSLPSVFEFQNAGAPVKFSRTGKEGTYASASTGSVMIMERAPHPNASTVFLNWLLSKEGQTIWTLTAGYPSRRLDAPIDHIPEVLRPEPGVSYQLSYKEKYVLSKDDVMPFLNEIFSGF